MIFLRCLTVINLFFLISNFGCKTEPNGKNYSSKVSANNHEEEIVEINKSSDEELELNKPKPVVVFEPPSLSVMGSQGAFYPAKTGNNDQCPDHTKSGKEICDGKDNDCDRLIDESFSDLGASCSNGIGACLKNGTKICSQDHLTTVCDAIALDPPLNNGSANCDDGIDNDCDNSIDCGDSECLNAGLNTPRPPLLYS